MTLPTSVLSPDQAAGTASALALTDLSPLRVSCPGTGLGWLEDGLDTYVPPNLSFSFLLFKGFLSFT